MGAVEEFNGALLSPREGDKQVLMAVRMGQVQVEALPRAAAEVRKDGKGT